LAHPDYPLSTNNLSGFCPIIKSFLHAHVLTNEAHLLREQSLEEKNMRKTILVMLSFALIAVSTVQGAGAAERRHARKSDTASASQQYRNANGSMAAPSAPGGYAEGGAISAPAGR
jgi:hypothetical protein